MSLSELEDARATLQRERDRLIGLIAASPSQRVMHWEKHICKAIKTALKVIDREIVLQELVLQRVEDRKNAKLN